MADKFNILHDLSPLLSPQASIVLPGDIAFSNLTSRWREYRAPNISVVVQVATEVDVQQTVSDSIEAGWAFFIFSPLSNHRSSMQRSTISRLLPEPEAMAQLRL